MQSSVGKIRNLLPPECEGSWPISDKIWWTIPEIITKQFTPLYRIPYLGTGRCCKEASEKAGRNTCLRSGPAQPTTWSVSCFPVRRSGRTGPRSMRPTDNQLKTRQFIILREATVKNREYAFAKTFESVFDEDTFLPAAKPRRSMGHVWPSPSSSSSGKLYQIGRHRGQRDMGT